MSKHFILTANRLTDGRVVFFDGEGGWSEDRSRALLAEQGGGHDAALARARQSESDNVVVAIEAVEVERHDGAIRPLHLRDRIRFGGPTIFVAAGAEPQAAPAPAPGAIDPVI